MAASRSAGFRCWNCLTSRTTAVALGSPEANSTSSAAAVAAS